MRLVALAVCLFLVALGALGIAAPPRLIGVVRRFQSRDGLWLVTAIRLLFGASLVLIAGDTRMPRTVHALGIFVFVAGLLTPLFGVERFRRLLDWWAARGDAFVRGWALVVLALGTLLAYAVFPSLRG